MNRAILTPRRGASTFGSRTVRRLLLLAPPSLLAFALATPVEIQAQTSIGSLEYREGHRDASIARRSEFMDRMAGGLAVITSADRSQPNLYEFFVPNSDNHDFIFLTGLETAGATLILCPESSSTPQIMQPALSLGGVAGVAEPFPAGSAAGARVTAVTSAEGRPPVLRDASRPSSPTFASPPVCPTRIVSSAPTVD